MHRKVISVLENIKLSQQETTRFKFINTITKNEITLSLIFNFILFTLFFLTFTPFFETNDDYGIMQIASGARYGEPSEYLIYLNIIYGILLKFLYQNYESLNWYAILFYLIHFISMTAILYVFLKHIQSLYSYLLYTLLFVFFEVFFLANLQFTTTSMVAGCSGIILLISLVNKWHRRTWPLYLIGITLQIISGMIRFKVYIMLLLLFAPVLILLIIKKQNLRIIFPFVIAAVIFGGLFAFNNYYYNRDPEWRYYNQYNYQRAYITDFRFTRYSEKTQAAYSAVGWSENDTNMFKGWFNLDQDKYSLDDIKYLVSQTGPELQNWDDIQVTVRKLFNDVKPWRFWFVVIISVISLAFASKFEKLLLMSVILCGLMACVYLIYSGRLPARILHSIIFSISSFSLYLLTIKQNHIHEKFRIIDARGSFVFAGIAVYLLLIGGAIVVDLQQNTNRIKAEEIAGIDDAIKEFSSHDYIYAIAPAFFKNQKLQISITNDSPGKIKEINFGGWSVPSPFHTQELLQYDLTPSYLELMRDDILTIAHPYQLRQITKFIKENHDLAVNFYPVISVNDYVAYKIVKAAIPLEPSGTITETRPIFHWSPEESAEMYHIQLRSGTAVVNNQYIKNIQTFCSDDLCMQESTVTLSAGDYQWLVHAQVNEVWQPSSEYVEFSIVND